MLPDALKDVFIVIILFTGYIKQKRQEGVFPCIICSELYELPKDGVDGLPLSIDVESVVYPRPAEYCQKHDMVMSWHCTECNTTMCPICYNEDHRDKAHGLSKHSDLVVRKKAAIQTALRDASTKMEKINQYRKKLEATDDQIARDAANEIREIDEVVNFLVETIQDKAKRLKDAVSQTADIERKKLSKSIEGLKHINLDFDDVKTKAKHLAQKGNDEDIEAEADDLLAQLTKDWNPSVPVNLVRTSWKSTTAELNRLEYDNPQLGTTINMERNIRFQFDILSYSGAKVTATEINSFDSGFDEWNRTQFCTSDDGSVFMSGKVGETWKISQFDLSGNQVWETESLNIDDRTPPKPCGLQVVNLGDKQFLASSSASHHNILLYDTSIQKPEAIVAYSDQKMHFNQIGNLPPNTLLALCAEQNKERKVLYLMQKKYADMEMMGKTHIMETHMEDTYGICVVSTNLTRDGVLIILTSWKSERSVKAFKLDGQLVWKTSGTLGGIPINPHGVCADRRGHIYVADGKSKRVLVLNAEEGKYIQTLLTNEQHGIGLVYSVGWSEQRDQRFLIVNHKCDRRQQITAFKIGYQVKFENQDGLD